VRHDIPVPRPDPASTPLSGRLTTVLMVWTGSLTVLVLAAVRDLPPVLSVLLLPYLSLVAWHLLARGGPRPTRLQPISVDSEGVSRTCTSPEVVVCPPTGGSDERVEASGSGEPNPPVMGNPGSPRGNPGRVRGRRRGEPSPHAASAPVPWIRVGPGRYIRGESPDPTPDRPAEPSAGDGDQPATPEVGRPPDAVPEESSRVPEAGNAPGDPGIAEEVEDGEAAANDLGLDRS
jgi:hypothetical protein